MPALSKSMRPAMSSDRLAMSMREAMLRSAMSCVRVPPLRSVPRLMLSCLEGTQALPPSGEITAAPR